MSEFVVNDGPATGLTAEEKQWGMFAHLSAVVAICLGGLGFVGPLIIWLIKRSQMNFVDDQGKESLNFQLNILGAGVVLGILGVPLGFLTFGLGLFLLFPLLAALAVYAIVMPILGAVRANAGQAYRYPYIIRVIE